MGGALAAFQLPVLLKGTSDDDVPCPGYLFEEIASILPVSTHGGPEQRAGSLGFSHPEGVPWPLSQSKGVGGV